MPSARMGNMIEGEGSARGLFSLLHPAHARIVYALPRRRLGDGVAPDDGECPVPITSPQSLTRYWIEFGRAPGGSGSVPVTVRVCGVTAASLDEALVLAGAALFRGRPLPPVERVIEGIDPAMLDAFHVGPNVLPPQARGVWYPPLGGGAR
jgi:hypothetical protein